MSRMTQQLILSPLDKQRGQSFHDVLLRQQHRMSVLSYSLQLTLTHRHTHTHPNPRLELEDTKGKEKKEGGKKKEAKTCHVAKKVIFIRSIHV